MDRVRVKVPDTVAAEQGKGGPRVDQVRVQVLARSSPSPRPSPRPSPSPQQNKARVDRRWTKSDTEPESKSMTPSQPFRPWAPTCTCANPWHPFQAYQFHVNPLHVNPLHVNPLHVNPLHVNQFHVNRFHVGRKPFYPHTHAYICTVCLGARAVCAPCSVRNFLSWCVRCVDLGVYAVFAWVCAQCLH